MSLTIPLPEWLDSINRSQTAFPDVASAMQFVIALSRRSTEDGGGPFGAAVLSDSLELVAAGVNRVLPAQASILHAEMLALLLAQKKVGSHDLSVAGRFMLVTSCAPCAMCLGAIPWSGIQRVVCGARGEDAEAIGFDEGDKPDAWQARLMARSIQVESDVCRLEAVAVLQAYRAGGGSLY